MARPPCTLLRLWLVANVGIKPSAVTLRAFDGVALTLARQHEQGTGSVSEMSVSACGIDKIIFSQNLFQVLQGAGQHREPAPPHRGGLHAAVVARRRGPDRPHGDAPPLQNANCSTKTPCLLPTSAVAGACCCTLWPAKGSRELTYAILYGHADVSA